MARDNSGNVLANQALGLQVKLHSTTSGGAIVYQETHAATTNAFGLFNVQIGGGIVQSGTFSTIGWGANAFYVEVFMDATGGSTYVSMGTQQLISVPYALHSKTAASTSAVSGTTNYLPKFTPSGSVLGNSSIFDNGSGYVGIGTNNPQWNMQLHNPSSESILQISSGTTGSSDLDGILVGTTSGGNAFMINYENANLGFGTNSIYRMLINGAGYVGIGTTTPQWNMQLNSAGVETALQITSSSSGSSDLDGLIINSGSSGNAYITNMENSNLILGTNGLSRLIINPSGNIAIGMTTATAKLDVAATVGNYTGKFTNSFAAGSLGHIIHAEATHTGNSDGVALYGSNIIAGYYGYGVQAYGGWYGGYFEASVTGTNTRYGAFAYAGGTTGASYGIWAQASGSGINYAGYFAGNVYTTGSYLPSDANLKADVKAYDNALAMIARIPVKTYSYKNEGIYGKMNLPEGSQIGIMAQDLEAEFPQLVKETYFEDARSYQTGLVAKEDIESVNFKAVNYTGLVPIMLKAMQEQNELIQKLEERIKVLEAK